LLADRLQDRTPARWRRAVAGRTVGVLRTREVEQRLLVVRLRWGARHGHYRRKSSNIWALVVRRQHPAGGVDPVVARQGIACTRHVVARGIGARVCCQLLAVCVGRRSAGDGGVLRADRVGGVSPGAKQGVADEKTILILIHVCAVRHLHDALHRAGPERCGYEHDAITAGCRRGARRRRDQGGCSGCQQHGGRTATMQPGGAAPYAQARAHTASHTAAPPPPAML
jgi:hypothetical protein